MKLLVSLLTLTNRAQDAVEIPTDPLDYATGPGALAGPGALGIANLLEVAPDAGDYVDYFEEDDSRARPSGSNGKPTGWKPSWGGNKNKRNGLHHIQSGADYGRLVCY